MLQAGHITIYFLNAGFWWDDGGAQFGIVPRELWEKEKPANARHRIKLSLTCPLFVTEQGVILVDTGIGNRLSERERAMYTPEVGAGLAGGLRRLGFTPADVTHVILSHLHFDHVGGVIDKSPSGEVQPVFANARVYIQRAEWELALAPPDERLAAAYRHAAECLRPLDKVVLLDGDTHITPQVRTVVSGGHTTPHQCVIVEAGGTGLIHLADIVPTTAHLRLAWNAAYDTDPLTTIAAKKRFFAEARAKNLWVSFSHDDVVAAGRLAPEDGRAARLSETVRIAAVD
ncbi:MAG: MBL fold metallo-hydrolase [Candidatus Binatia bacterium]|nr:MBL fold metallo-hydrolase [Candidatus Binatia bacterium]